MNIKRNTNTRIIQREEEEKKENSHIIRRHIVYVKNHNMQRSV